MKKVSFIIICFLILILSIGVLVSCNEEDQKDISLLDSPFDFKYNNARDDYTLVKYNVDKTKSTIQIPNEYKGKLVTCIGESAFKDCENIGRVIIPESITHIGSLAFANCKNLRKVILPNSIISVDGGAFQRCPQLQYTLKDGIKYLGNDENPYFVSIGPESNDIITVSISSDCKIISAAASYFGNNVLKVIIPKSIVNICDNVFNRCDKIIEVYNLSAIDIKKRDTQNGYVGYCAKEIYTSLDVPSQISIDDDGFVFYINGDVKSLVSYIGTETDLVLPSGITEIYYGAFRNQYTLNSVVIPDTVTHIGDSAFLRCEKMTKVTIPNSIVSIGDSVFANCKTLKFNEKDNVYYLGNQQNKYLVAMDMVDKRATSLSLVEGCKIIDSKAFNNCSALITVTLSSTITNVGKRAFNGCDKLVEIYNLSDLPLEIGVKGYGYIASYAKNIYTQSSGESKLSIDSKGYIIYSDDEEQLLMGYVGNETDLILPHGITIIYKWALSDCLTAVSIEIPNTVKLIGIGAFGKCVNLTSVIIPKSVMYIGDSAFYGCTKLFEVYNLSTLRIVEESSDNGRVGEHAKNVYTSLDEDSKLIRDESGCIIYTEGDSKILLAYVGNDSNFIIPEGVTEIYHQALYGCVGITNITIPNSVTHIRALAFENVGDVKSITFNDTSTWYATSDILEWSNKNGGTEIDFSNPIENVLSPGWWHYLYKK